MKDELFFSKPRLAGSGRIKALPKISMSTNLDLKMVDHTLIINNRGQYPAFKITLTFEPLGNCTLPAAVLSNLSSALYTVLIKNERIEIKLPDCDGKDKHVKLTCKWKNVDETIGKSVIISKLENKKLAN